MKSRCLHRPRGRLMSECTASGRTRIREKLPPTVSLSSDRISSTFRSHDVALSVYRCSPTSSFCSALLCSALLCSRFVPLLFFCHFYQTPTFSDCKSLGRSMTTWTNCAATLCLIPVPVPVPVPVGIDGEIFMKKRIIRFYCDVFRTEGADSGK